MATSIDAEIRLLTADDLGRAMLLSSTAGWNQRLADWRMLLQLAPAGSFTAIADGRIVGTAIGIDYGNFGWIAMMLVDPAYRGHGLGARLLEAAMAAIPEGLPIRLDATPMGRPLYQRYGFEDEIRLTRHVAEASPPRPADTSDLKTPRLRGAAAADLDVVARLDSAVFRANRRILFDWALEHGAQYAHIIEADIGTQYCFGRPGRLFDQIGPVVAGRTSDAAVLIGAALSAAENKPVVVDAFDARDEFSQWLRVNGFEAQRPLFRMRRGNARTPEPVIPPDQPLMEFAIFGPEFA